MPIVIVCGNALLDGEQFSFEWFYPSSIVKEFLKIGSYPDSSNFIELSIEALIESNKRVRNKFGFECFDCKLLLDKLKVLKKRKLKNVVVKKFLSYDEYAKF